jgi:GNAT superfamily N-acetyltransferase
MSIWQCHPYRQWPEVSEDLRLGDRSDPAVRLAIARWIGNKEAYVAYLFRPTAHPATHFVAYRRDDKEGLAVVASISPLSKEAYPPERYRWEERKPTRRALLAYERNEASRRAMATEYETWAEAGLLSVAYGFDISQIEFHDGHRDSYSVLWKGTPIAQMIIWQGIHDNRLEDERSVFKVYVEESFRRKKVATKLYDHVEEQLARRGLHLRPSPALSDDGYAFWGARAPELLATRRDPPKRKIGHIAFGVS